MTAPKDCLSGGRYCTPDPGNYNHITPQFQDGAGILTGVDVLTEDLRQICIFKQPDVGTTNWWNYVTLFSTKCLNEDTVFSLDCYKTVLKELNIEKEPIQTCMDDSFEGDKEKDDNKLFREERNLYSKRGIYSYPSVIINWMTFRVKITMFC